MDDASEAGREREFASARSSVASLAVEASVRPDCEAARERPDW